MFEEELNKVINDSKNIVTIKVYNKLIRMEELKGGGYVTETKFQGQTQFILNHISSTKSTEKPIERAENIEHKQKNSQPKPTVIRKGGKTITRMEIPD